MNDSIVESDWKLLRQLHPIILDRFCQRVLSEVGRLVSDTEPSWHKRYLAVFDLIKRRDVELAETFDELRRSNALLRLANMHSHHLLTEEEFGRFSSATRDAVDALRSFRVV